MASTPSWTFGLDDDTRRVLAHDLVPPVDDAGGALDDAAWRRLLEATSHHRLSGLLVAAVASGALATTAAQAAEAAQLEVGLTRARMSHEFRAISVLEPLDRAGIDLRVLKGAALAALDYPDPQWRPSGDLDLLVRGEELDRAVAALAERGGVRTDPDPSPGYAAVVGKGATMAMPDGFEVDLHRLLTWGAFGVRVRVEDLWDDEGRTFPLGGRDRITLSVDASLLHACTHLVIRGWRRALTLRDVGQLLVAPDLDADRVLWLARRWGNEAVLAAGVGLAHRELGLAPAAGSASLAEWAAGYEPTVGDRVWLRVERPGAQIGPMETIGAYTSLATGAERSMLRRASLHPAPGTWLGPAARAQRASRGVVQRVLR